MEDDSGDGNPFSARDALFFSITEKKAALQGKAACLHSQHATINAVTVNRLVGANFEGVRRKQ
jgi:hypothetical protein